MPRYNTVAELVNAVRTNHSLEVFATNTSSGRPTPFIRGIKFTFPKIVTRVNEFGVQCNLAEAEKYMIDVDLNIIHRKYSTIVLIEDLVNNNHNFNAVFSRLEEAIAFYYKSEREFDAVYQAQKDSSDFSYVWPAF